MAKQAIITIVVILIIAGTIYLGITVMNKKSEEKTIPINFRVYHKGTEIPATIVLYNNITEISKSNFRPGASEQFKIENSTYLNIITNSSGYYNNLLQINATRSSQKIELKKTPKLSVSHSGTTRDNEVSTIKLKINTTEEIKKIGLCFDISGGYYFVRTDYKETEIPERLKYIVNKCYDTNLTTSSYTELPIETKGLHLTKIDSIKTYIIDQDIVLYNNKFQYRTENSKGEDIGAKDYEYIIS